MNQDALVKLNAAFGTAKIRPEKLCQTKRNGTGVSHVKLIQLLTLFIFLILAVRTRTANNFFKFLVAAAVIYSFGGMLMDANDKSIQINSPNSVRGLQFVVDLKEKYGVIPQEIDFANDYTNMQAGFKTGKYAMILNGPWAINDLLSGPEFKDPDNLGIAPIPAGPEGQSGTLVGGHNYVISSNTKNAAAAYKFIEFLNSKESQVKFAVKNNLLPTRKSAYQVDAIKNNRIISDFKQVIDKGVNRPVIPEAANFWENFHPSYQAALKGVKTPQGALDEVAAAWNKLLKGQ